MARSAINPVMQQAASAPAVVFVVDDDEAVRDSLAVLLGAQGYQVETFGSAHDFLRGYGADCRGCLITDIRMPGISGLELQEHLNRNRSPLPVIVITGHGDIALALQALRAGAVDFIEKPCDDTVLLGAVARALAQNDRDADAGPRMRGGAAARQRLRLLSPRERSVLDELARGRSVTAVAALMDLAPSMVERHRSRIMRILKVSSEAELVRAAWAIGMGPIDPRLDIACDGDPAKLLNEFVESARSIIGARLATAVMMEIGRGGHRWIVSSGTAGVPAPMTDLSESPLLADVAASRRPVRLGALSGRTASLGLPRCFADAGSFLAVPLGTRDRVSGWLALMDKQGSTAFDEDDERIAVTLARQGAQALELELLNLELSARVEQQQAVASLGALAVGATELNALFEEAASTMRRVLDVDRCGVFEIAKDRAKAVMVAGSGAAPGVGDDPMEIEVPDSVAEEREGPDGRGGGQGRVAASRSRRAPLRELTVLICGMTQPFGLLRVQTETPKPFTEDQIGFVRTMADVLGQAVVRRQTEESLRKAQKMESIGQLTGGMAHDFNNLLTVILGNAQFAGVLMRPDDHVTGILNEIEAAARRGADLTHRLLAFSRRQTLKPAAIDVATLVLNLRDLLARTLGGSIEVVVRAAPDVKSAFADEAQVESALLNLAINARDAMPAGGRLTIATSEARIDDRNTRGEEDLKPGDYVVLSVMDTGTGMPAEILTRVFEPFFTTKAVGEGTGLGLSMVYGFARQSGGGVRIHSEPGQGTVVKVFLPRADAGADERSRPEVVDVARLPAGRESILVVEDDDQIRRFVVHQLRSVGYQVIDAHNGPAAVQILHSSEPIDLMFSDLIMPGGMNGLDVAAAARRIRPDLKVLFASGYPEAALSHDTTGLSATALLQKPYDLGELTQALRRALA